MAEGRFKEDLRRQAYDEGSTQDHEDLFTVLCRWETHKYLYKLGSLLFLILCIDASRKK
jgi:hypothetical protein